MGYKRYNFAQKLELLLKVRKILLFSSSFFRWHHRLKRLVYALEGKDLYKIFVNAFSVFQEKEIKELLNYVPKLNVNDLKYFYELIYHHQ